MPAFKDKDVRTTFLQKLPFLKFRHQLWSPLRPRAFRKLDLSEFDVVISVDTAEAKNVRVRKDAIHICYCNSPIRYYWSHYKQYKKDPGLGKLNFIAKLLIPIMVDPLRRRDYRAAQKVDYFIGNSDEVVRRIRKYYRRKAVTINPPVDAALFSAKKLPKKEGFIIAGRQTPYKRFDLAIQACNELELPLTVIGNGSEHERLKEIAGPTIKMLSDVDDKQLVKEFQKAQTFIFPTEEDFGIVPIEAMAAGCSVIAYAKGGVKDWMIEGKTGEVFHTQSVNSLKKVLLDFKPKKYKTKTLQDHAETFNPDRFRLEIKEFVGSVTK